MSAHIDEGLEALALRFPDLTTGSVVWVPGGADGYIQGVVHGITDENVGVGIGGAEDQAFDHREGMPCLALFLFDQVMRDMRDALTG